MGMTATTTSAGRLSAHPTDARFRLRVKLNPVKPLLTGKKVLIVEDSIIRGTTSRNRVKNLHGIGIREIHMVISCPPTLFPCPYGIDFSSKGELIAAVRENEKAIADFIGLDSLHYLTVEGMVRATGLPQSQFCLACYTGDYPIARPKKWTSIAWN
jgi:amidophosphoribosyltransferase